MGSSEDARIRRLFAEPPERFVAARNALADALEASGDPAAAGIRALKRPTRRLWILNQMAREHPDQIRQVLAAGAELKRAHAAALRGEPSELREADREMSRRLDDLVAAAAHMMAQTGHPAAHALLVGMRTDLRTVATRGGQDADRLRTGTLGRLPPTGGEDVLGGTAGSTTATPRKLPPPKRAPDARRDPARARREAARAATARTELRRVEQSVVAAERELRRRERAAERAQAAAAKSRAAAEAARKQLDAARARRAELRGRT